VCEAETAELGIEMELWVGSDVWIVKATGLDEVL
jgi:hypothetical protein